MINAAPFKTIIDFKAALMNLSLKKGVRKLNMDLIKPITPPISNEYRQKINDESNSISPVVLLYGATKANKLILARINNPA
jgi:hypothetical protein